MHLCTHVYHPRADEVLCVCDWLPCANGHRDSCCCTLSLHSRMYSIVRLKSHALRASNLKCCNLHNDWCNYCHTCIYICWAYESLMGQHNHKCNTVISLHFMALKSAMNICNIIIRELHNVQWIRKCKGYVRTLCGFGKEGIPGEVAASVHLPVPRSTKKKCIVLPSHIVRLHNRL